MTNLSAPLMEVSRLLDLVPYISTHSHISLKELSQEFGISEKEMVKELTNLSMCGLPGYTPYELIEVYFESGFVTINNHDPLDSARALTTQEIASLYIGLQILKDLVYDQNSDAMKAIDELITELQGDVSEKIDLEADNASGVAAQIHQAIGRRRAIRVSYTGATSNLPSERVIEPLELIDNLGRIYLSAFCFTVNGYRTFRIDRLQVIEEVDIPSRRIERVEAASESSTDLELRVRNNPRRYSEIFQGRCDGERISSTFYSTEWLLRAVIASGGDLELATPTELRPEIRSVAEKILALYPSNG